MMEASATKEAAAPTKARIPATGNQLRDDSSGEDSEGNPEVPIWDLGVQTDGGGGQVSLNVIRSHLMGESEEEEALSPRPADTILTTTLHIANVLANLGDQATRLATAPTGGNFWVSPTRQRHEKSQDDFDAGVREGQFEESSRLPQHAKVCGCPRPLFQSYLWKTPDSSVALPPGTPETVVNFRNGGVTVTSGVTVGAKRTEREQEERRVKKKLERVEKKLHYNPGAIIARGRTGEGYPLPSGKQSSCLPDAGYNALKTLCYEEASLQKLRKLSMPELGNNSAASWASFSKALITLEYPFKLVEVTSKFCFKGPPMLNLLNATAGVYLVSLCVTVDGKQNKHCVMLSTIAEEHAPFGKLIDNHSAMKPAYLEEKDLLRKGAAKKAWKKFVGQNPAVRNASFAVDTAEVYALVSI